MRTWLSKSKGYVIEKPNDCFTGVLSSSGAKIYEGDTIEVTKIDKKYIGKYHKTYYWQAISDKEYNNPKNWEITEKRYIGKVYYDSGRFFIDLPIDKRISEMSKFYGSAPRLEIYHDMTGEKRYGFYNIEIYF